MRYVLSKGVHYFQIQIIDKNRLKFKAFDKSMPKNLAKTANSWLRRPPEFLQFLEISDTFFQFLTIL